MKGVKPEMEHEIKLKFMCISAGLLNDSRIRRLMMKYGHEVISVLLYVFSHCDPTCLEPYQIPYDDDLIFMAIEKIPRYREKDGRAIISDAIKLKIFEDLGGCLAPDETLFCPNIEFYCNTGKKRRLNNGKTDKTGN